MAWPAGSSRARRLLLRRALEVTPLIPRPYRTHVEPTTWIKGFFKGDIDVGMGTDVGVDIGLDDRRI